MLFNVYLFYGLVFFTIGCVISFRNFKFSKLAIASALPALALFGITHAFHEWSELYFILYGDSLPQEWGIPIEILRILKLLGSFLALVWFAWLMLNILSQTHKRWLSALIPGLLCLYGAATLVHIVVLPTHESLLLSAKLTRWIFGLMSGGLAGIAMILYGKHLGKHNHPGANAFAYCGMSLLAYALAAGLLSSSMGLWVPIVRTLCALALLLSLLQALRVFEQEYHDQIQDQQKRVMRTEKLRAIGELASGIAHEIKTPLSYATLSCDLLERQLESEHQGHRQLQRIRHGLERANHISQEVLNFARHQGEHQTIELGSVIRSAIELIHHPLREFQLRLSIEPNLNLTGNPIKLEEVIINLMNNAIDACTDSKRITLKAWQDTSTIHLSIEDSGGGMPDSQLPQAMSPFFTTKPQGQGTGLGLAICQQIIQQHQGDISLCNGQQGLLATISLPRSDP